MPADSGVCVPNISAQERRKRLVIGMGQLVLAVVVLVVLVASGAGRWWRLALFVPFFLAASGFFQWREKT